MNSYRVVRYYGDTEIDSWTIASRSGYHAARAALQGQGFRMDMKRDGDAPGSTRWTLTDRHGGPAGSVEVVRV